MSRLWISAARPDQLVNVLAVARGLRAQFDASHFLHEGSAWWKHARWEEFPPVFAQVAVIPRVATCRGLWDARRMARELRGRQEMLLRLGVQPDDVFICIGGVFNLSNAIASAFPAHAKILCTTRKSFVDASRPADFRRYRFTTSSALQYFFLHRRAGLQPTLRLKPWWPRGGDGARLERLGQPFEELYQAVMLLSNEGIRAPLPDAAASSPRRDRIFLSPYPAVRDLAAAASPPRAETGTREQWPRVLFFGTPFLTVSNLPPREYVAMLDRCLSYLRTHYARSCRLIYRPHPAETEERNLLRLEGFEIEEDREVAELYFLKHFAQIAAVFSVSSTVSRVAYNYGLNAYAFWPCFPFHATAREYFATLMDAVPDAFHLQSLDQPPVRYQNDARGPAANDFAEVLLRALAWARAGTGSAAGVR